MIGVTVVGLGNVPQLELFGLEFVVVAGAVLAVAPLVPVDRDLACAMGDDWEQLLLLVATLSVHACTMFDCNCQCGSMTRRSRDSVLQYRSNLGKTTSCKC